MTPFQVGIYNHVQLATLFGLRWIIFAFFFFVSRCEVRAVFIKRYPLQYILKPACTIWWRISHYVLLLCTDCNRQHVTYLNQCSINYIDCSLQLRKESWERDRIRNDYGAFKLYFASPPNQIKKIVLKLLLECKKKIWEGGYMELNLSFSF